MTLENEARLAALAFAADEEPEIVFSTEDEDLESGESVRLPCGCVVDCDDFFPCGFDLRTELAAKRINWRAIEAHGFDLSAIRVFAIMEDDARLAALAFAADMRAACRARKEGRLEAWANIDHAAEVAKVAEALEVR